MDSSVKKQLFILSAIIVAILSVVTLLWWWLTPSQSKKTEDQSKVNSYTDPYSGETVYNPPGRVPERYRSRNDIVYLGLSELLNHGFTEPQVGQYKVYIKKYSDKRAAKKEKVISEVTINFDIYKQIIDKKTGETTVTFDIILNRNQQLSYIAKVFMPSVNKIEMSIYSKDDTSLSTPLFDSKTDGLAD